MRRQALLAVRVGEKDMEETVKVMCGGREIDRITHSFRKDRDRSVVIYREQLWPVEGGCIYVENESGTAGVDRRLDAAEWRLLVTRLLPGSLPALREECFSLLRAQFGDNLPDGIVCAISSLTSMGLEQEARELLIYFLCEKHDSERLSSLLQTQLLTSEVSSAIALCANADPTVDGLESEIETGLIIEDENLQDWDWAASDEAQTPEIDDMALRVAASRIQGAIGSFASEEKGAVIPDLTQPFDDALWTEDPIFPPLTSVGSPEERALVERTAKLSTVAQDVLRYFADNPGDRAAHAELVLGYHVADINKLLSGSLNHYLKKSGSGGWECHPWVSDILLILDKAS
ncbi:hypothetical protein PUP68_13730 [Pseudomonas chlororaphis]|uniref:hypothetical protein n=1 Tax=Pseudomonas chlororaphis TaxID=587753 RepID=UPI0023678528|nr:hypothetical protein [Pseudomonas chlororaphis]WDG79097.1 hypothetical protein PUP77_32545 [Pseudomonas chlororaphis]WDG88122.1 hypothetical protein PUP68_13730 [Pseudomonas chlororaphis]